MIHADGAKWMIHSWKAVRWGRHRRAMAMLDVSIFEVEHRRTTIGPSRHHDHHTQTNSKQSPIRMTREIDFNLLPRAPPAPVVDAMIQHLYFDDYQAVEQFTGLEHGSVESSEYEHMRDHACMDFAVVFHLEMLALAHHLEDDALSTAALDKIKDLVREGNAAEWEMLTYEMYGEGPDVTITDEKLQKELKRIVLAGALRHGDDWMDDQDPYFKLPLEFSSEFPRELVTAQDMRRRVQNVGAEEFFSTRAG